MKETESSCRYTVAQEDDAMTAFSTEEPELFS